MPLHNLTELLLGKVCILIQGWVYDRALYGAQYLLISLYEEFWYISKRDSPVIIPGFKKHFSTDSFLYSLSLDFIA